MKKRILVLLLAVAVAGGAFAEEADNAPAAKKGGLFSAGAGAYLTSDFGGGLKSSYGGTTATLKMPYFGGGGYLFFDATYAELSFGLFGGSGTVTQEQTTNNKTTSTTNATSLTGLDIGVLGKYPIALGGSLTVFPLLGINYRAVIAAEYAGAEVLNPGDSSALWFKFGGGLDYAITANVFLRANFMYGFRLATKSEKDLVDVYKNQYPGIDVSTRLGHGLDVKVAVGYKF
jgi:opacity protein-like surface antigen